MDYETNRSKGFAHVQFAAVEGAAAAIAKSGEEFCGREVFIDSAKERAPGGGGTPGSAGRGARSRRKRARSCRSAACILQRLLPRTGAVQRRRRSAGSAGGEADGTTIFVKGFNRELGEDEVRSQLMEAFKECGEISAVRLPTDRETGDLKGIGFVEFATSGGKVRAPAPRSAARPACGLPRCMRAGREEAFARRPLRRRWTAPRLPAGTSRWTPTSAAAAGAAAAAAAAAAGLAAAAALAAAGAAAGAGALTAAAAAAAAALAAAAAAASTGAAVRFPADLS